MLQHLLSRCLLPSAAGMGDPTLTILIIEENPVRAAILEDGMREAGYGRIIHVSDMVTVPDKICAIDPDVIVISLENASRDTLEQMFQVSRTVRRPIAMFVDTSDTATIKPRSMPASAPMSSTASRKSGCARSSMSPSAGFMPSGGCRRNWRRPRKRSLPAR